MGPNEGQYIMWKGKFDMLYINACFHICYGGKNNPMYVLKLFFTVLTVPYSIFQNGLCVLEMKNLPRISENAWNWNSISMHIWSSKNISSCYIAIAVYFSDKLPENRMLSPLWKHCWKDISTLSFCQKVFLGCEFAVFACVAQRPRTVSAG